MRTASATFSASGWRTLPKLEKESRATRGCMPRNRAISEASRAISASSAALGRILTVASANSKVRFLEIIR
jgi:hypothetical protein